jgi:hypothetical protein
MHLSWLHLVFSLWKVVKIYFTSIVTNMRFLSTFLELNVFLISTKCVYRKVRTTYNSEIKDHIENSCHACVFLYDSVWYNICILSSLLDSSCDIVALDFDPENR